MKDVQATGEASSPQKQPALKNNTFLNFYLFCCGSFLPARIGIRIQPTKLDSDQDQQHWNIVHKTGTNRL